MNNNYITLPKDYTLLNYSFRYSLSKDKVYKFHMKLSGVLLYEVTPPNNYEDEKLIQITYMDYKRYEEFKKDIRNITIEHILD